jgi:hypothetical protein
VTKIGLLMPSVNTDAEGEREQAPLSLAGS